MRLAQAMGEHTVVPTRMEKAHEPPGTAILPARGVFDGKDARGAYRCTVGPGGPWACIAPAEERKEQAAIHWKEGKKELLAAYAIQRALHMPRAAEVG